MSERDDEHEKMKQELTRSERHRNPDLRAQRIAEIWTECGDWTEAVQNEALERGVELSRASARAKASVFRRRLANSPYWEEMLRQLPPGESARRNIETLLRAETEANVVYQGRDTGLPDHRTRIQSVRQQQELRRGMDRTELGFHELDLGHDRLEMDWERNAALGNREPQRPNVVVVFQLPDGTEQVMDADSIVINKPDGSKEAERAALSDGVEAEGKGVAAGEAARSGPRESEDVEA
ncbi:MAG: hypothetical protein AB1696_19225 [Planctomycetota bacterium]